VVQRVLPTHYFSSWIDLPESVAHLRFVPEMLVALLVDQRKDATDADKQRVKENPDFPLEVARRQVMFHNASIEELSEGLNIEANTLTKYLSRNKDLPSYFETIFSGIDVARANGLFGIVIHINSRNELKILGEANDPCSKLLFALGKAEANTIKAALKLVRRRARQTKWDSTRRQQEETAAIKRVSQAYVPLAALLTARR